MSISVRFEEDTVQIRMPPCTDTITSSVNRFIPRCLQGKEKLQKWPDTTQDNPFPEANTLTHSLNHRVKKSNRPDGRSKDGASKDRHKLMKVANGPELQREIQRDQARRLEERGVCSNVVEVNSQVCSSWICSL